MAGELQHSDSQPRRYLSRNQQDLLLAALNSQAGSGRDQSTTNHANIHPTTMASDLDHGLFISPETLGQYDADFTPDGDFLDGDQSFDFEDADLGGDLIGGLPSHHDSDHNEKRKNPSEDTDAEEGDSKRQEVQEGERSAKKPGRKPLTNEPTTKRKAQNRAAQRAFRERKEKHLKDLETKVAELEKAKEADRHENGLLKAQLERMSVELREYRKRLSLNNSNRSPTSASTGAQNRSNSGSYGNNFSFDFPKFGSLPGSQMFDMPQTASPGAAAPVAKFESATPTYRSPSAGNTSRQGSTSHKNSVGSGYSPVDFMSNVANNTSTANVGNFSSSSAFFSTPDNMHGFASTLPQMDNTSGLGDLFSPSILKSASVNSYFGDNHDRGLPTQNAPTHETSTGGETTAGLDRVFQFNGGSNASDSTSPSVSSGGSQWNANGLGNSSCETSPEPSHDSPQLKDKSTAQTSRQSSMQPASTNFSMPRKSQLATSAFGFDNIDFSVPSATEFDPILFGDYRDSQDAIVGDGDFTGGFFDDALNSAPFDFNSPSNLFGILQSPQPTLSTLSPVSASTTNAPTPSRSLLAEIDKTRDGGDDDYGLPSSRIKKPEGDRKLISCNKLWTQLQANPDFQDGKFDLDGLCAELRTKAKCSESGVMVDQAHVDQALRKLGQKDATGRVNEGSAHLMFENDSWERVMQKFGQKSQ